MEKTILNKVGKTVLYAVLAVASFLWVYPFLWMISASFKTQNEFFASGLNLIPQSLTWTILSAHGIMRISASTLKTPSS